MANETPINETRNAFLGELASHVRKLDQSRLVSAALLASRSKINGQDVITIDDPIAEAMDILSVNTYHGWYSDDDLSYLPQLRWASKVTKPLILSEFGADAKYGYHVANNPPKFSEEFQKVYYQETLKMADKIPFSWACRLGF